MPGNSPTHCFLSKKKKKYHTCQLINLHFLTNSRVFLKQQINIDIKVACSDAPRHAAYHLAKGATA